MLDLAGAGVCKNHKGYLTEHNKQSLHLYNQINFISVRTTAGPRSVLPGRFQINKVNVGMAS